MRIIIIYLIKSVSLSISIQNVPKPKLLSLPGENTVNKMLAAYIKKKERSGLLPLIALLICLLNLSCTPSNSKQATTSETPQVQEAASKPSSQLVNTKVVTTFLPMYLFTKAVAGDAADVEILVPPGTEVHEYQATPNNVKAIATANVLVKNGLGLEEFLENTVKNAQNSKLVEIDASQGIKPLGEISPVVTT